MMSQEGSTIRPAPLRYGRGQSVYGEGSPSSTLYRSETGLLRVVRVTSRGRTLTVRHLLPGDYFGEEVFEGGTHVYRVEALTRALVTSLEPDELQETELLEVTRSIGEQMRRTMHLSYHLQTGDLKQRIVRYLLELADTPLGGEDANNNLFVQATHELLAEGTSSTRESVSKVVTELREEGLIESGYRQITLKNLEGLKAVLPASKVAELV
jgi:CRP/FNR family transcriptional regulator, LitR-dependent transcriptional activator